MRLIDADALKEKAFGKRGGLIHTSDIDAAPTVEAERKKGECKAHSNIVYCRECKYSKEWYKDRRRCFMWAKTGIGVWEDGYCYYGVKGDNEWLT